MWYIIYKLYQLFTYNINESLDIYISIYTNNIHTSVRYNIRLVGDKVWQNRTEYFDLVLKWVNSCFHPLNSLISVCGKWKHNKNYVLVHSSVYPSISDHFYLLDKAWTKPEGKLQGYREGTLDWESEELHCNFSVLYQSSKFGSNAFQQTSSSSLFKWE